MVQVLPSLAFPAGQWPDKLVVGYAGSYDFQVCTPVGALWLQMLLCQSLGRGRGWGAEPRSQMRSWLSSQMMMGCLLNLSSQIISGTSGLMATEIHGQTV